MFQAMPLSNLSQRLNRESRTRRCGILGLILVFHAKPFVAYPNKLRSWQRSWSLVEGFFPISNQHMPALHIPHSLSATMPLPLISLWDIYVCKYMGRNPWFFVIRTSRKVCVDTCFSGSEYHDTTTPARTWTVVHAKQALRLPKMQAIIPTHV